MNTSTILDDAIAQHLQVIHSAKALAPTRESIATEMARAMLSNKAFWCRNNGSAAGAQHLVAELDGRPGMAAVAVTTDTLILRAIGNDLDRTVGRQIEVFIRQTGGSPVGIADIPPRMQATDTGRLKEAGILCRHILCDWAEACFLKELLAVPEMKKS